MKVTIRWLAVVAILAAGVALCWPGRAPTSEREAPKKPPGTQTDSASASSGSELDDALGNLDRALSALESRLLSIDKPSDGARRAGVAKRLPDLPDEVEALKERYEASGNPQERVAIMREFALRFPFYARQASGELTKYLDFLRKVAADGRTADERRDAIISVHGLAGDKVAAFFEEHTRSPFPEVRFYAAEGLAWSARAGDPEATDALVRTLSHDDPRVREIVALCLGTVVRSPRLTAHMLARLRVEHEPRVIRSLVRSIVQVSGDEGRRRIEEDVVPVTESDARASIERALAKLKKPKAQ